MNFKLVVAITLLFSFIALMTFSMMKFQLVSARPDFSNLCSTCHPIDQNTQISVVLDSETSTTVTYLVSGSDNYNSPEGWAVFDSQGNNIANGTGAGSFTLPKNELEYTVYWVDDADGDTAAPDPDKGGSAMYTFTIIPEFPTGAFLLMVTAGTTLAFFLMGKKLPRTRQ